jgi:hypothetical protein
MEPILAQLLSEVRSETYGARIDCSIRRVIMGPDSILAVWRAWLV